MKDPAALPASYQEHLKHDSTARVVCDYIAGMTDNFIRDQYRQAFGASL
jgi:dGTPase